MTSGHSGALSTVHASTPRDAASRLETLCLMSDTGIPVYVARAQVASAIDIVVQLIRRPDGVRQVKEISECLGLDNNEKYSWQPCFELKSTRQENNALVRNAGVRSIMFEEAIAQGFKSLENMFEKNELSKQ